MHSEQTYADPAYIEEESSRRIKRKEKTARKRSKKKNKFECDVCLKIFKDNAKLREHKPVHLDSKF